MKFPMRYIPKQLSLKDKKNQKRMILLSKKLYKKGKYFTRKKLSSFHSQPSKHIVKAKKIYGVEKIVPSKELSQATGCSVSALQKIVKKGEGAYFSSGSRPNQTAQSWGYARLASAITGGKSAAIDYDILKSGCQPNKTAMRLANQSLKKYGFGKRKSKKINI